MKTLTSVVFLLLASISVSAGIRPSFSPEASSWRATDIVVVTEDKEIDGVFRILETWKGDLKPGETITISEMEEFKNKQLDDSIDELNKLGLNLDKNKDVSVTEDQTQPLVSIVIFLNKNRPAKESLRRSIMKRGWYP